MAAEDAKRLGGELPNSFSPGKRVLLTRRARGVVGVISPWNWPYTMPAELVAPALACGNAVVWTPAPSTAVCAVALARCIADADLPPGVFNLVTGPGPVVGDEIARNPETDGVAFIGSTATGRLVGAAAAGKATLLEMGGNGPLVVLDDADVEAAVEATLTACFLCAGQSCTAGERILVHRAVRDQYVERLARAVTERIVLGDPFADADDDGSAQQRAGRGEDGRARRRRARARRDVVTGGSRASGFPTDLYWQPTVLDGVPADARVAVEETFGPVAPVVAIDSLERGDRAHQRVAVRPARGDLHRRSRARARVRRRGPHRLGQHQRVEQLLGGAPAVRRPRRHRQRHRQRRRRARDALVHRAADDRRSRPTAGRGEP